MTDDARAFGWVRPATVGPLLLLCALSSGGCLYHYQVSSSAILRAAERRGLETTLVTTSAGKRVAIRVQAGDRITLWGAGGKLLWQSEYRYLDPGCCDWSRVERATVSKRNAKRPIWITGAVGLGVGYALALGVAAHDRDAAIPVVGPFIVAHRCDTKGLLAGIGCFFRGMMLYGIGSWELVGMVMLGIGASMEGPHRVLGEATSAAAPSGSPAPPPATRPLPPPVRAPPPPLRPSDPSPPTPIPIRAQAQEVLGLAVRW